MQRRRRANPITYAINRQAFSVESNDNFSALPLLDAAYTAHTSRVRAPFAMADGMWKGRKRIGCAYCLLGGHDPRMWEAESSRESVTFAHWLSRFEADFAAAE